ncbi:MAG: alcohol dehydrogenase catalytic domain-containing protein [Planctomycetaceae bacterium]|nr:alcohol dehydrogenase catalytic domain-containing protein [Planctomycetaceae bacterium]
MLAAVYEGNGVLNVKDVPLPALTSPTDVLINVKAISICGTDVRALTSPPAYEFAEGIVVGHECVGVVTDVGNDVSGVQVGDHVVVHPNNGCGKCMYCRTGKINLCEHFKHVGDTVDGVMAEYAVIPEKLLYKISPDVPAHIACLAEPLACVLNGTETIRTHPGETVVVHGAGPIGLLFLMLYKAAGATVVISDPAEGRGKLALDMGADYWVNPIKEDLAARVHEIAPTGADIVTDAVGVLLAQSIPLVKKGGNIVIFGLNAAAEATIKPIQIVMNELHIHGCYIAKGTFPMAVKILERGLLPMEKLVTHRLPIQEGKKGLELMKSGEGSKVVIEFN